MKEKYDNRFRSLIAEGKKVIASVEIGMFGEQIVNRGSFVEWRTKVITLLSWFVKPKMPSAKTLDKYAQANNTQRCAQDMLSFMEAIYDDFKNDMFDSIQRQAEAAVSVDYLKQAEQLLKDKEGAQHTHIAAAVLAGGALEKCLRTMCQTCVPPISIVKTSGKQKTLSPLIDDLVKAQAFNEVMAKQLRAWADIRNAAAHGRYGEFSRDQVQLMLTGINSFLSTYMK